MSGVTDVTMEIHGVQKVLFVIAKCCRQVHCQPIGEGLNKCSASILWNIMQLLRKNDINSMSDMQGCPQYITEFFKKASYI